MAPSVVFVLGGPGAGKGTQCDLIEKEFGFMHLSAGDLLREERNREGSEYGDLIEKYIREGAIVPVEITVNLLKRAMEKRDWEHGKFLIDGFPRNEDNLDGWERVLGGKVDEKFCLFFDCPEDVMEKRLLSRGKTSGRSDDNLESIRKRFRTYEAETRPIIERFKAKGKERRVNADRSVDEVWSDVKDIFEKI
ncbi:conserved hypothetical protein [Perkinsus marinus ATCC 50983]|uniref:UMP-CMP kinase n=1 Tax=Perkinsus marinus (strain ATCC 50983 / TXsc) TaxID=423536 RepID=C5KGN0_PERM5|nr:conserved hypothetical protein [Perkinsus marinus ATCC 50983]XP_002784567.1 conserved hypothetical protein [Perkinsus marinus ATCC 50983]EER02165.1 conserved hypothetical protein [Perkinsus marinus ATCC 50983]EER16363.1 conserved hypothetical protein [Perkinsus marinus ATCC 50983]|eukprot:XP_002769447.1 conserved hypothetical protein [Perkinsus marinus ATCC 50983]